MYVVIDAEMGGRGLDKSLLQVAMLVTDNDFTVVDELNLALKPDDGIYHATAEALSINKIDLVQHDSYATTYLKGKQQLYHFLHKHSKGGRQKLTPVGLNLVKDLDHVCDKLISRGNWENMTRYGIVDIGTLWAALIAVGKIAQSPQCSLRHMCTHFEYVGEPMHTALSDAHATLYVFKKLMELLRK
jgi:hypothetical protein